jgi:hypothetical protein
LGETLARSATSWMVTAAGLKLVANVRNLETLLIV